MTPELLIPLVLGLVGGGWGAFRWVLSLREEERRTIDMIYARKADLSRLEAQVESIEKTLTDVQSTTRQILEAVRPHK